MQNTNTKEMTEKGVIVLNASELPQENISVGNGENYLLQGDSYDWLKKIPENSIDSTVCDPPYLLNFMGKEFDREKGNPADDVVFWELVLRTMKPGAYLLAAGIGRTHHRLMTAIENAGFEIKDCVYHCFGSGFPKSSNIEKQLIKMGYIGEAKDWRGYGTALKPAIEIWTLARKPLSEKTIAENCLRWHVGGINIDKCRVVAYNGLNENTRISKEKGDGESSVSDLSDLQQGDKGLEELSCETKKSTNLREDLQSQINNGRQGLDLERGENEEARRVYTDKQNQQIGTSGSNGKTFGSQTIEDRSDTPQERSEGRQQDREFGSNKSGTSHNEISQQEGQENGQTPIGRWPSNFIHDGSDEVVSLFPRAKGGAYPKERGKSGIGFASGRLSGDKVAHQMGDDGSASRFFYCAKASKSERNRGCEGLPLKRRSGLAGADNDKEILDDVSERFRTSPSQNNHPTVKPIALMEYLIKMVTPKGGIVLDPFAGSGSTLIACKNLGRNFIGIEKEADYIEIAKARLSVVKAQ